MVLGEQEVRVLVTMTRMTMTGVKIVDELVGVSYVREEPRSTVLSWQAASLMVTAWQISRRDPG